MTPDHEHTFEQFKAGEFDPALLAEARQMTAAEFHSRHGGTLSQSGNCVAIGRHDYFWTQGGTKFDGFGRLMV